MSRHITFQHLALICLIAANIGAAFYLTDSSRESNPNRNLRPVLGMKDIEGRPIPSKFSIPWLVEIIDGRDNKSVEEVKQVVGAPPQQPFGWIIFTTRPRELAQIVKLSSPKAYVVDTDLTRVKALLGTENIGDLWLLYDRNGTLRTEGNFVHGGLIGELASLVDGAAPFSSDLVESELMALDNEGAFQTVHANAKRSESQTADILFVDDFETGCSIEEIVRQFDASSLKNTASFYMIAVPSDWTTTEIRVFERNLALHVPTRRVSRQVTSVWSALSTKFGNLRVNGFLATFGSNGIKGVQTDSVRIYETLRGSAN